MSEAFIIDAVRTPRGVGKVGKGALADIHPQQLGATVLSALRDRNNIDTAAVDDVIFGTSMQVGTQGGDLFRSRQASRCRWHHQHQHRSRLRPNRWLLWHLSLTQ